MRELSFVTLNQRIYKCATHYWEGVLNMQIRDLRFYSLKSKRYYIYRVLYENLIACFAWILKSRL